MSRLASLDGPSRSYLYRSSLGKLGCGCSETENSNSTDKQVTVYTTDLALSNHELSDMKVILTQNGINYSVIGGNLSVTTPNGTVNVPALADSISADEIVNNLKEMLKALQSGISTTADQLTPDQKKWSKWLLILGGSWLTYELLFKSKRKGVTVNVNTVKGLNGLGKSKTKINRKPERKVLPTISI